jgi:hypothetical protein
LRRPFIRWRNERERSDRRLGSEELCGDGDSDKDHRFVSEVGAAIDHRKKLRNQTQREVFEFAEEGNKPEGFDEDTA